MDIFQHCESNVRSYCRTFPTVFDKAYEYYMIDENGRKFIDFFSGAGVLNYGHNNPRLKHALLEYIQKDNITHSLDMATVAKRRFLEEFSSTILRPRHLSYKIQFPGPTGTNAVEAAMKLARKVTGRHSIAYFEHAFHGMTLGSISVSHNPFYRQSAGVPLHYSMMVPFDNGQDSLTEFETWLTRSKNKADLPAAIIVETIQAEGGVRVARVEWLQQLEALARKYDILLIVDDIQVGCGRTGTFFSFESANITPDIICLSKSLSGYGLPLSIILIKPEHDVWEPGEHTGTFRGHNPAFVTATQALTYWKTDQFEKKIAQKAKWIEEQLKEMESLVGKSRIQARGRGLIWGIEFAQEQLARKASQECFDHGLLIETCGKKSSVLKLLPPLIMDQNGLEQGVGIIKQACNNAIF